MLLSLMSSLRAGIWARMTRRSTNFIILIIFINITVLVISSLITELSSPGAGYRSKPIHHNIA